MGGLMERIGESVKGRIAGAQLTPLEHAIRKLILREFARTGKAPDFHRIMEGMGLASEEAVVQAIGKLKAADILVKREEGIISAYPFSALETRHRLIFGDGRQVYALCATDALGIHFVMGEEITILSRCPWCEGETRVVVRNGGIALHNPEGMLEFVSEQKRCGCTAETCCPYINFFCSVEHLANWKEQNPEFANGETYSLDQALQHGKAIFEEFLR